jgi:hypothetical protein
MKDKYKIETINLVTKIKSTLILQGSSKEFSASANVLSFRPASNKLVVHYWQTGRKIHFIDTEKTMTEALIEDETSVMSYVRSLSPDLRKAITHNGNSNEMYISDIPKDKTQKLNKRVKV